MQVVVSFSQEQVLQMGVRVVEHDGAIRGCGHCFSGVELLELG